MIRKIFSVALVVSAIGFLSCSDGDEQPLIKKKEVSKPNPPPQTVTVTARMQATTSKTADVYYMSPYPTGGWIYVGTISGTSCQSLGNFSAGTGDVIYFAVFDGSTGVSYRATAGTCATVNNTLYCGDPTDGSGLYSVTVGSSAVAVGIQVVVANSDFVTCI